MPDNSTLLQIASYVALAGAIYGGIRADIKAIHEKLKDVKEAADEAHQRLDRHIEAAAK